VKCGTAERESLEKKELARSNKQPTSALAQTTPDRILPTGSPTNWTLGPIIFREGELDVSQATRNPAQPNPGGGDVVSGCSALGTNRDRLSELHAVAKAILPRPLFRCLALNTAAEIASLSATEIASRNRRIGYTAQHLRILK
jgi:hypothetical protein